MVKKRGEVRPGDQLAGLDEIAAYIRRGKKTVLSLIRHDGFPAVKIAEQWTSDTALIAMWLKERIAEGRINGDQKANGRS